MQDELDKTLAHEADEPRDTPAAEPEVADEPAVADEPEAADEPAPTDEPETPTESCPAPVPLSRPDAAATQPMPEATIPLPAPDATTEPVASKPVVSVEAPSLRDVGHTTTAWLKGRAKAAGAFLSTHRLVAIGVALACVAAVLAITLLGLRNSTMPTDEQIRTDALAHLGAPTHTMGSFDLDEPLVLQTVDIASKHPSKNRNDGCTVDVVATFANAAMETRADAQLTYVREGDGWACSAGTVGSASHRATAAIDRQLILDHLDELLQAADTDEDGRSSLESLYRTATTEVSDAYFDEESQTCEYALHLTSSGTFVAYECDLVASFRFAAASGAWELANATVSRGAKDLGFSPLVDTWKGTFVKQSAVDGRCLAARDNGLTVQVTKAASTDGGAVIEGTLSGVAHMHPEREADADATDGDQQLDSVPFTGTCSDEGLVFTCETQDISGGTVTLTLTFGTPSAPDDASAALESAYTYDSTLLYLIPYQRTDRFVDVFTLEKQQ